MAELKRIWMVQDNIHTTPDEFLEDPALKKSDGTLDEEAAIAQFCDPEGHPTQNFIDIMVGAGPRLHKGNVKFYDDKASALADAKKRFEALKKKARKKQAYTYQR